MIDKLLSFTHPSQGERRECCLAEICEQTLELIGFQLREVEVEKRLEPVEVEGEAAGLGQIVLNLLSNARDAVQENEQAGKIRVSCGEHDGRPFLSIWDNGPGIDPGVQKRIFEPFFTTKPVGSGSGLGLSLTYQILKQHGATIEVESAPQNGTCFFVRFSEDRDDK